MRSLVLICLIIFALIAYGCAQEPQPLTQESPATTPAPSQPSEEELKTEIDQLVTQVASDDWSKREEATNKLRNFIKELKNRQHVIELLKKRIEESSDQEVRWRIESVIDSYVRPWKYFEKLRELKGHEDAVNCIVFAPDSGLLASGSDDRTIRIWNPHTGECLRTLWRHKSWVNSVAYSPDGKFLASAGADGTIRIWNPETGKRLRILEEHGPVAFSPDGKLLASGGGKILNSQTCECLRILKQPEGIRSFAFSPDGKMLAAASGDTIGTVRIWNPQTGECLVTLTEHPGVVDSVAFNPDGNMLASAGQYETIHVWDPHTGKLLRSLTGHSGNVRSVAFSPDGKMLASAGSDETVRIWDPDTGECLRTLEEHITGRGYVTRSSSWSLAFSPDGRMLAADLAIWGIREK